MTRLVWIECDHDGCDRAIRWTPDGVNDTPKGWKWLYDEEDDEASADFCPNHESLHEQGEELT